MKQLILTGALFVLLQISFAGVEKETVKSSITEVTVYTQGAQIYRKANYTVKPGITEIILDDICPTIDPKSIQVKAGGNIVILDSKYSLHYPEPVTQKNIDGLPLKIRRDIQLLEDSLLFIGYEIQEIQDEIDVLKASKNILSNNGAIKGQGKVNDSIPLLKQAMEYYALKMNEINKQLLKLERKKNEKNQRKNDMQVRLNNFKNYQINANLNPTPKGPSHRITITVSSKDIATGKLSVSYLVSAAGWTPQYDIRTEHSTGKVNLNYKAHIFQNTGVNWDEVKLTVSTNNPYQNKTKPTLHPWYIDYYSRKQNKPASSGYYSGASTAPSSSEKSKDSYSNRDLDDYLYDAKTSADFVQMVEQVISAEFRIDLPYSIESNNQPHLILINNTDLTASFKYYAVPKLDASVYLVAQISKLEELQLVPAKANIFFDGSYIGETYIDPATMDDTLSLSLGKDPNLLVKRTLVKKESKERIIGNNKEKTNSYVIEVRNQKSTAVTIIIQDQLPITQNADISIEGIGLGKAKFNTITGLVEWEVTVKPKENKNIEFGYKIKHGKDYHVAYN